MGAYISEMEWVTAPLRRQSAMTLLSISLLGEDLGALGLFAPENSTMGWAHTRLSRLAPLQWNRHCSHRASQLGALSSWAYDLLQVPVPASELGWVHWSSCHAADCSSLHS